PTATLTSGQRWKLELPGPLACERPPTRLRLLLVAPAGLGARSARVAGTPGRPYRQSSASSRPGSARADSAGLAREATATPSRARGPLAAGPSPPATQPVSLHVASARPHSRLRPGVAPTCPNVNHRADATCRSPSEEHTSE